MEQSTFRWLSNDVIDYLLGFLNKPYIFLMREVCVWFSKRIKKLDKRWMHRFSIYNNVLRENHLQVIKWCHARGWKLDPDQTKYYVELQVLKWMHSVDPKLMCKSTCNGAAYRGRIDILEWLEQQAPRAFHNSSCYKNAIQGGQIKALEWLFDREDRHPKDYNLCTLAIKCGKMQILKWLGARRQTLLDKVKYTDTAAALVSPVILKWLVESGCRHEYSIMTQGRLESVKYGYELGYPLESRLWSSAACAGDVKLLEWLKENYCPYDAEELTSEWISENIATWIVKNMPMLNIPQRFLPAV